MDSRTCQDRQPSDHPSSSSSNCSSSKSNCERERIRSQMKMVIGQLEGILQELKEVAKELREVGKPQGAIASLLLTPNGGALSPSPCLTPASAEGQLSTRNPSGVQ